MYDRDDLLFINNFPSYQIYTYFVKKKPFFWKKISSPKDTERGTVGTMANCKQSFNFIINKSFHCIPQQLDYHSNRCCN